MNKSLHFCFYLKEHFNDDKLNKIHFNCLKHYVDVFYDITFYVIMDNIENIELLESFKEKIRDIGYINNVSYIPIQHTIFEFSEIFSREVQNKNGLFMFAHNMFDERYNVENLPYFITSLYYLNLEYAKEAEYTIATSINTYSFGAFLVKNTKLNNYYKWQYYGSFFWCNFEKLRNTQEVFKSYIPPLYDRYYTENYLGNSTPLEGDNGRYAMTHNSIYHYNIDNISDNIHEYIKQLLSEEEIIRLNNLYEEVSNNKPYKPFYDFVDKVFVINLVDRKDRRERIIKQFKLMGVYEDMINKGKLEFIDAVRYPMFDEDLMKYIFESGKGNFYSGANHKHNVGLFYCSIEHFKVAQIAYERGYERIMVLEDDVSFVKDKYKFYEALNKLPENFHILHLEGFYWPVSKEEYETKLNYLTDSESEGMWVESSKLPLWATACLIYSRKGMKHYIDEQRKFFFAVDSRTITMTENCYAYSFPLATQGDKLSNSSDITENPERNDDVNVYQAKTDVNNYWLYYD